ncbi:flagellar M-ring protein FliF [Denitratisoma sp. DHT3]|uniref:flagellar basal-body MS-ring/collar protein FliF n=1 Tax=Denitratisoma sp. DHT3 TaxID=1981880 RepID=UPI0011985AC9|nr:flagellar basal-body MS-ring/collar protein FliF [Denitratisoma sp. DHT3]QDX81346.1 flagellar M-ring protein FliF [Denitratisoma sp. DHT3]
MANESPASAEFPLSLAAFNRLPTRLKIAAMVGVAIAVTLVVGAWLWARQPEYAVLFSNLSEQDGGQIVTTLQQQNVPYRFSEGGGAILVPSNQVHDIRLRMAAQGIPKGGLVGFEVMENQKLGASVFLEQINYQRALEGELARTISTISSVKGARVHLAIPKQSAFLRDEQRPTASVLVNLHPGRSLDGIQIAGIVHLVSASVPDLNPSSVSVVDQDGNLISQQPDSLRNSGLDPTQLKYVREVEAGYIKRIEAILAPIVGSGNVRAQVTADVDFSHTDQVAETYKPNPTPETAIRSQQTNESGTGQPPAVGVPGALSNQPPVPATAPITTPAPPGGAAPGSQGQANANFSRNATINYELDKTIRHVKGVPGVIRRLSVAVVVNQRKEAGKPKAVALSDAEMRQINDLVREAMGFDKERGDTLNVANAPFSAEEANALPQTPLWKDPGFIATLKDLARYLAAAVIAYLVWTRLLKPLFRKLSEIPLPKAYEELQEELASEGGVHHGPPRSFDAKMDHARNMARENPKAIANVIKEWISGGESR